jgi:hypothetical protein
MSDELELPAPNSPTLPTTDGIVKSAKEYSDVLTLDMTDAEIKKSFEIIVQVRQKYHDKWVRMFLGNPTIDVEKVADELEMFRDELVTRLAEGVQVLATVDASPVLNGQPPIVDIIGHLPGSSMDQYGFDHERKQWEVQRATERGEDYLGQKRNTRKKES